MAMSPSAKADLKEANARFDELPADTKRFTEYHWGIPTLLGVHINFYPSRMKWDDPSDGQIWYLSKHCHMYPAGGDNFFYGTFEHLLQHIVSINMWATVGNRG